MQTVRLPILETEDSAWQFFEILFEELRCEPFYEKSPTNKDDVLSSKKKMSAEKKCLTTTTTLTFSASAAGLSPPLHRSKKEEKVIVELFNLLFNSNHAQEIQSANTVGMQIPY